MSFLTYVISLAIFTILAQNIVFQSVFGFNIVVYASQKRSRMGAFSLIIFTTTLISSVFTALIDMVFEGIDSYYIYMPIIYIMIISAVYFSSLYLLWRYAPRLYARLKSYVHIAVFNCAVLGSIMLNGLQTKSFGEYMGFALGLSLGFIFAGYLLLWAGKRLNSEDVPRAFRGYPITMVYAGIISMAFYALSEYSVYKF